MVSLARALKAASLTACLIVCASFAVFAIAQTSNASHHQQEELAPAAAKAQGTPEGAREHEGSARSTLDRAASDLTSPFAGIVSATSSEWAARGVRLLLALLVYGFGVGYLVRVIRVRV